MNTLPQISSRLVGLLAALLVAGCAQPERGPIAAPSAEPEPSTTPIIIGAVADELTRTPTPVSTVRPVSTATPTPTRTPIPCTETQGEIVLDSFTSRLTGEVFNYRVYLPPCYGATARRYPTLYILHGLGWDMDDEQWDRMGIDEAADQGYAQEALPPMIIVMPNGNDADHAALRGPSPFPEVIVDELIPHIDAQYCTWAEPDKRAIGGLSRGGFWAYWTAFTYPERFGRVGGHSPYFYQPAYPSDKNPFNIVDTAEGIEGLEMYIDHGGQGRDAIEVQPGVEHFVERLAQRGIEPEYVVNPYGDHIEEYWADHVAEYLTFYAEDWPHDVEDFPTCHAGSGG